MMQSPRTWRLGRYVLTGTPRRLGSRVRLSLMLTDIEMGTVIWRDRLIAPFDGLVGGLDELLSQIAVHRLRTEMRADLPTVESVPSTSAPRTAPVRRSVRKSGKASKAAPSKPRRTKRTGGKLKNS